MYRRSSFLFINERYNINKKIIQNGVPLENMLDEIKYIAHKFDIFKTKIKSNAFYELEYLQDTLTYKNELQSVQLLYTDISNTSVQFKQELDTALKDLEYYKNVYDNQYGSSSRSGFQIKDMSLNINTSLKKEYIIYIKNYGIPSDGIFLESILNYIKDINKINK